MREIRSMPEWPLFDRDVRAPKSLRNETTTFFPFQESSPSVRTHVAELLICGQRSVGLGRVFLSGWEGFQKLSSSYRRLTAVISDPT